MPKLGMMSAQMYIAELERDNADLARRIVNGASETIAHDLHVAELEAEVKRLRLIEDRVRAYLDVKKSWDNGLRQLKLLKAALEPSP